MDSSDTRIAKELFLRGAAPLLVREVATILAPSQIQVMPLKGVLLQRLVYETRAFRPIGDVDLLVPPVRFAEARTALQSAGFTAFGEGQDVFRRPDLLLEIDLHKRLSTTTRCLLVPEDMFRRGSINTELFGAPVVIPCPVDLYAHLLLHLTLHWVTYDTLHHPEDLEAVPEALGISVAALVEHLATVGLTLHAALVLPLLEAASPRSASFTRRLLAALSLRPQQRLILEAVRRLCSKSSSGSLARRTGGFLLAPSLRTAARDAALGRIFGAQRSSD